MLLKKYFKLQTLKASGHIATIKTKKPRYIRLQTVDSRLHLSFYYLVDLSGMMMVLKVMMANNALHVISKGIVSKFHLNSFIIRGNT